jgi:hypothetical protein
LIYVGRTPRHGKLDKQTWEYLQPLIEFYNLHLVSNPYGKIVKEDKHKMQKYLEKYAPDVVAKAEDWFESDPFTNWVIFWKDMRRLMDGYMAGEIGAWALVSLQAYMQLLTPTLILASRARSKSSGREVHTFSEWRQWKKIDLRVWQPEIGVDVVETGRVMKQYGLEVGRVYVWIVFGFYKLLQTRALVKRCAYATCENIFVPHPQAPSGSKAQKYCPKCKKKRKKLAAK